MFLLPIIIFGLLFNAFVKLFENTITIIFLIFGTLVLSNFINTFTTHWLGEFVFNSSINFSSGTGTTQALAPFFKFELPCIIKNEYALFGGVIAGWIFSVINRPLALKTAEFIGAFVQKLFSVISVLIPLFIVGFVVKCASEKTIVDIMKNYSQILLLFIAYAAVYTYIFYLIASKLNFKEAAISLKNMIPAFMTAVSTISSALTMPVTIACAEKNAKNKELAGSIIPSTVNIHLLGDCIAISLLAYAILKHYGLPEPSLSEYFIFTCFFVLAKFSVAAVPAGGVIVMTPILEKYLSFTPEMSTLLIAIYVLFDPLITGFNVLGNGALAKIIDNLSLRLKHHVMV